MGVSGRVTGGLVVSALLLAPSAADAAAIRIEQVVAAPQAATLTGDFTFDNDVALFSFDLAPGEYSFLARTTSYAGGGFDPFLALYGPDNRIVTYDDGTLFARNDNVSDVGDPVPDVIPDSILQFLLPVSVQTRFTLALIQAGNEAIEEPVDGLIAFTWDDDGFKCATAPGPEACQAGRFVDFYTGVARGGDFSLELAITPADTAPIPEPGTLSLLAIGSGAALIRRRRARQQANRS
jgi:hypothetical protein